MKRLMLLIQPVLLVYERLQSSSIPCIRLEDVFLPDTHLFEVGINLKATVSSKK